MNGPSYDSAKLDLADAIRGVMEWARNREHAAIAEAAQRLLAALAEDRFQLAVAGRFNGGKSSLMNAMLGRALLPTGMRPLTSVITSLCYGSRDGIEVFFRKGSLPARGRLDQIAEYATEEGNPANGKEAVAVLAHASIELLRYGFYFVETPGIGSDIAANTATTERYLPEADAVIFVTSFDSAMRPEELAFLSQVRRHAGKIFYVVNKLDLAPEPQRTAALQEIRRRIEQEAGGTGPLRIFALSARDALEAKLRGDAEALAASGLPDLEATLIQFLEQGKSREFLTRMAARTKALIAAERFYTSLAGRAPGDIDRFDHRMKDLFRDAKAAVETVSAKVRMAPAAALEADLRRWSDETLLLLNKRRDSAREESPEESLKGVFGEQWNGWVEERKRSPVSHLLDIAGDEIRLILRLPKRPGENAAEALGAEVPPIPGRFDLLDRVPVFFLAGPEPPDFARSWWSFGEGARRRAVDSAVWEYAEATRARTVESALDWVERLFRAAWRDCEVEIAVVRAAMQAESAAADARVYAGLEEIIDSVVNRVREIRLEPQPDDGTAGPEGNRNLLRCRICAKVAGDVYTYLSKDQYDLATDPRRQADHADEGGFCTLHAWQYESIAAPQGVCLAYAPLLQARAREIAAAGCSSEEILKVLEWAPPSARRCRICRFIAERERAIACDLAVRLSSGGSRLHIPLCVLHLRTVIQAGVAPAVARELAAEEARWLERCARDMRMYALKHYAIRRELATEEERTAYSRGVARVAGERAIAFSWRGEE